MRYISSDTFICNCDTRNTIRFSQMVFLLFICRDDSRGALPVSGRRQSTGDIQGETLSLVCLGD